MKKIICPSMPITIGKNVSYRTIYDNGIKVTINSDDCLIFNKSVSDEYLALFKEGVFSPAELDEIRKTGIEAVRKYNE